MIYKNLATKVVEDFNTNISLTLKSKNIRIVSFSEILSIVFVRFRPNYEAVYSYVQCTDAKKGAPSK